MIVHAHSITHSHSQVTGILLNELPAAADVPTQIHEERYLGDLQRTSAGPPVSPRAQGAAADAAASWGVSAYTLANAANVAALPVNAASVPANSSRAANNARTRNTSAIRRMLLL